MKASWQGMLTQAFAPFIPLAEGIVKTIADLAQSFTEAMKSGGMVRDIVDAIAFALKGIWTAVILVIAGLKEFWTFAIESVDVVGSDFAALGRLIAGIWTDLAAGSANFFQKLGEAGAEAARFIGSNFIELGSVIANVFSFNFAGAAISFGRLKESAAQAASNISTSLRQSLSGFDFSHAADGFHAQMEVTKARMHAATADIVANAKQTVDELKAVWGLGAAPPEHGGEKKPQAPFPNLSKGDGGASAQDAIRAAMAAVDGQIRVLREGLTEKKALLDQEVAYGQITAIQKVAQTRAATEQEYQAELALLQKELAMLQGNDEATLREKQQVLNKISALQAQHTVTMIQLATEEFNAVKSKITEIMDPISSGISSQVNGLIAGTTSWKNAIIGTIQSIETSYIQMMLKVAANWAATKLAMLFTHTSTEASMTAATAAGASARTGLQAAAAAVGAAAEKVSATTTITTDAAKAAAGAYAAVSQIPIIGPVLAPAAAAVAFGAVEAFGSFSEGSWGIPRETLAMLHPGEIVMPSQPAGGFRDIVDRLGKATEGGASVRGGDVHFHVSAIDGASVKRFFETHADKVAKVVGEAWSGPSRSLRPTF